MCFVEFQYSSSQLKLSGSIKKTCFRSHAFRISLVALSLVQPWQLSYFIFIRPFSCSCLYWLLLLGLGFFSAVTLPGAGTSLSTFLVCFGGFFCLMCCSFQQFSYLMAWTFVPRTDTHFLLETALKNISLWLVCWGCVISLYSKILYLILFTCLELICQVPLRQEEKNGFQLYFR